MTATLTTSTGLTHRLSELREVIGNYFVTDGDRDRGAFGAKARTACGRTYEGLAFPDGSGVNATCAKCEATEEAAAEEAAEVPDTLAASQPRFSVVRLDGRWKVYDLAEATYATCASRAKAEEKAAKLNADRAATLAADLAEAPAVIADTAKLTEERAAAITRDPVDTVADAIRSGRTDFLGTVGELLGGATLDQIAARQDAAPAAVRVLPRTDVEDRVEASMARKAAKPTADTRPYRVGARLAAAAEAATALTLGADLRAKLAAKTPAKDGTKLIHLTATDAAALDQVARNLEGTAREGVTAGDLSAVSLVFSCTQAQARLATLFA